MPDEAIRPVEEARQHQPLGNPHRLGRGKDRTAFGPFADDHQLEPAAQATACPHQQRQVLHLAQPRQAADHHVTRIAQEAGDRAQFGLLRVACRIDAVGDAVHAAGRLLPRRARNALQHL